MADTPIRKWDRKQPETLLGKVREIRVSGVMSRDLVTVTERTTVKELHRLFEAHNYNVFPVVKGRELIGTVTKLDLLRVVSVGMNFSISRYWKTFAKDVGDIMHGAAVTLRPDDTIMTAANNMVEFDLRSIPVVEGKRLVGIVSWNDLMEHLVLNDGDE